MAGLLPAAQCFRGDTQRPAERRRSASQNRRRYAFAYAQGKSSTALGHEEINDLIMYITRSWFSDNELKGFMACTPAGYRLVVVAGGIGLLGWLQFLGLLGVLIFWAITRWFEPPTLWLFVLPLACRVLAMVLDAFGRSLAARKQFEYHYKPDFASWLEGDVRRTYPPNAALNAGNTDPPATGEPAHSYEPAGSHKQGLP